MCQKRQEIKVRTEDISLGEHALDEAFWLHSPQVPPLLSTEIPLGPEKSLMLSLFYSLLP